MALLINDPFGGGQAEVDLGRSKIQLTETYGVSAGGISANYSDKMKNVDSLVSSIGQFTNIVDQKTKESQDLANKELMAAARAGEDIDTLRTGNQTGGAGGAIQRFVTGSAGATPAGRMAAEDFIGQNSYARAIAADPDYQKLINNNSLFEDGPDGVRAELSRINAKILAEQGANKSQAFLRGWGAAFQSGLSSADQESLKAHTAKINEERGRFIEGVGARSAPAVALKVRSDAISTELGVEPQKVHQIVAIENGSWDAGARSPTGVVGLTQITQDRYNEIKTRIARDNPELAARMKDRTDPESSLIALTAEIPVMEKQAQEILGRPPTTAEAYLLWNIGAGGGADVLKAIRDGKGDQPALSVASNDASRSAMNNNAPLYVGKTVNQAMALINQKMKTKSDYHTQTTPVGAMKRVMFTEADGIPEGSTRNNYTFADFKNSGVMGGSGQLDSRIVQAVDQLSSFMGRKIAITSANRTADYNAGVGGAPNSRHIHGDALDVKISNVEEQKKAIRFLSSIGVRGISAYAGHLHFDIGGDKNLSKRPDLTSDDIIALKAEGARDGSNGGYTRVAGFNGNAPSSFQAQVESLARQTGHGYAETRKALLGGQLASMREMALTGNVVQATQVSSDLLSVNGNDMSTTERNLLRDAQTANLDIGNKINEAKKLAERTSVDSSVDSILMGASKMTDPRERAAYIASESNKLPQTLYGRAAAATLMQTGINFANVPETVSKSNAEPLSWKAESNIDFWKDEFGFSEPPKSKEEAYNLALKSGRFKDQLRPEELRGVIEKRYEVQARGFLPDSKGGASQVGDANFKAFDSIIMSPFRNAAFFTTIGASKEALTNQLTLKAVIEPYEQIFKMRFDEVLRARVMQHRVNRTPGEPDLTAISKEVAQQLQGEAVEFVANLTAAQAANDKLPIEKRQDVITPILRDAITPPSDIINTQTANTRAGLVEEVNRRGEVIGIEQQLQLPQGASIIRQPNGRLDNNGTYAVRIPGQSSPVFFRPAKPATEDPSSGATRVEPSKPEVAATQPVSRDTGTAAEKSQKSREANSQVLEKTMAQNIAETEVAAVKRTVNGAINTFISNRPEVRNFDQQMMNAKTKAEELAIGQKKEDTIKSLTEQYSNRFIESYETLKKASAAFDAAPPGKREEVRKAYRAARAAWAELTK